MIRHVTGAVLIFLALALGEAGAQVIPPTAPLTAGPTVRPRLGKINSWGYQLQRIDPERVARSPYDLMVVDYSSSGQEAGRLTAVDIQRMQTRPDGSRRVVLAYLSIGEAEDYRYYWRDTWVETVMVLDDPAGVVRPAGTGAMDLKPDRGVTRLKPLRLPKLGAPIWLGRENESWPTNFFVRYWDPSWQSLIIGEGDSFLSRIISAGFDGVFLDRIDTFQSIGSERPEARQDMIRFVVALADRARRQMPGFLVVPQNGEQLLSDPAYLAVIDAVAKEDLLYGDDADGQRNPVDTVGRSMRWLAPAVNRGLSVLVVEYVRETHLVEGLSADIRSRGFVPYFGVRALDRLVLPEDLAAPSSIQLPSTPPPIALDPRSPQAGSTNAGSGPRNATGALRDKAARRPAPGPQRPAEKAVTR